MQSPVRKDILVFEIEIKAKRSVDITARHPAGPGPVGCPWRPVNLHMDESGRKMKNVMKE